jgi:hypothetical protein
LAQLIRANVAERNGEELPIEARMLRSIARTFENSELTEESLPARKIRNWGNKNLFDKAKDVGLDEAYSSIFGGPSRNVHGGWQDLLQHHLNVSVAGTFTPRFEFSRPRPQVIYSLTHLIAETLIEYVAFLKHPAAQPVRERLSRLVERNMRANDLHENYLVAKAG